MSTNRQEQSLDAQREALLKAGCDENHIYHDSVTGRKWNRPGLKSALDCARPGDTIMVTRLDRLGSGLQEAVLTIADLGERNISVQSLDPALDTSKSADKIVMHVMQSLADWGRGLFAQRTQDGLAHARSQGRMPGPKPKLNDEQAHLAKKAVDSGDSVAATARAFGVSRQTLYRAMDRISKRIDPPQQPAD